MKLTPRLKIGIIVVLLIAFLTVLNLTDFSKGVKNFFYLISSPIQKSFWQAGDKISGFFGTISKTETFKKENEELKMEIERLLAENTMLLELKKENKILKEALELGLEKEFKLLLADIIGKDISQDVFLINKGLKDGVVKNLPVINQQKILLGRVGEVYENFARVILISNKKSSFDAGISETEIQGVVKGKGNGKLFLELIPSNAEVNKGDLVATVAFGGIFPKGLLAGRIKEVIKSDIQPFQEAEIEPISDIKNLDSLFIIVNF